MKCPHLPGFTEWQPIARGGLAVVWRARQVSLDRLVAVKVYQRGTHGGDGGELLPEAAAAGRLPTHPGIVTAYDAGCLPDGRPYLVMALCPGGSLTRWLDPGERPNEEQVRHVGVQIADALAAAHACGVLHRDVKPANILIDRAGHPALADFGQAAVRGQKSTVGSPLRLTPAYAPPEAFTMQPATEAGDVFSLAATLHALLAGSPPRHFDADPPAWPQMIKVAQEPIPPLPGVNWHLMDVVETALSLDAAQRPSAAAFRDQLARVPVAHPSRRGPLVSAGRTFSGATSAQRPGSRTRHPRSRRPRIMALTAALVAGLLAGALLLLGPISARGPAAMTRPDAGNASVSTTSTASSAPSTTAPRTEHAEQVLEKCRERVRTGDRVIKHARAGVGHWSQYVRAQVGLATGTTNPAEARRTIARTRRAGLADVDRYRRAVAAHADQRGSCRAVPGASAEIKTQLQQCARRDRAQAPVLRAAGDLMADWQGHEAQIRRSQAAPGPNSRAAWIRTLTAAAPHFTAWRDALAAYPDIRC